MEQIILSSKLIDKLDSMTIALHDAKYFGTYELAEICVFIVMLLYQSSNFCYKF